MQEKELIPYDCRRLRSGIYHELPDWYKEQMPTRIPKQTDVTIRIPLWEALELANKSYEEYTSLLQSRKVGYRRVTSDEVITDDGIEV